MLENTYLHGEVGIAHAAVDGQGRKRVTAVFLHSVENGLGLEASGLEGGTGNVAALGVRGDTN